MVDNITKTSVPRYEALKKLVSHELGIDFGDIATLGLAGLAFYVYRKLVSPTGGGSGTGAVDTRGMIDETIFRATINFFENSAQHLDRGTWKKLVRVTSGRPCLEGNGGLIAEYVGGIHQILYDNDPYLSAKFREYLFAILFTGADGSKRVRDWIERLVSTQNSLTKAEERWNQILTEDATVHLFLGLARKVQAIIEKDGLVESEWPQAYDKVAFELIARGDIQLPITGKAKKKFLKGLKRAQELLELPVLQERMQTTALEVTRIKQIEALSFHESDRLKRDWKLWAMLLMFLAMIIAMLPSSPTAPPKQPVAQPQAGENP